MSDRERWIVYPLLLFAVLPAAKSRLPQPADLACRSLRCNEIFVTAADGTSQVHVGGSPGRSGELQLYSAAGQPVLVLGSDQSGKCGMAEMWNGSPAPHAVIGADADGGFAQLMGKPNAPSLFLGYDSVHSMFGLWAVNEENKPLVISHPDRPVLWGMQLPFPLPRPPQAADKPRLPQPENKATTAPEQPPAPGPASPDPDRHSGEPPAEP